MNRDAAAAPVRANRARLRAHAALIGAFFAGGVAGALGFQKYGAAAALPLAAWVAMLAARPLVEDLGRARGAR